jgi:hypothetical protein
MNTGLYYRQCQNTGHATHRLQALNMLFSKPHKQTQWPASELYLPSDHCLSAKLVLTFSDRKCRVVSVTDSYGRILNFIDRSLYFFFHIAPQLYWRSSVDPFPDTLLIRRSGSAANRTRTYRSVARNCNHQTTEATLLLLYLWDADMLAC